VTRIIAGGYGGRRLVAPPGRATRPTADRVREALFNSLSAMVDLGGARVADLYAGSGAIGLEAASRGASHVLLVEADPTAARAARANIAVLDAGGVVTLATAKVEQIVAAEPGEPYDVVFADPPYALGDDTLAAVLATVAANGWLGPDGVLVVERSTRSPEPTWPQDVTSGRGRRYGETTLWYGRRS
jgi:16S rRNA (guanine(966)-N(2))-methyltransferase RsmD